VDDANINGIFEAEFDQVTEALINSSFRLSSKVRGKFTGNNGEEYWGDFQRIYQTNNDPNGLGTEAGGQFIPTASNTVNITGAVSV
ncbi:hypothetical protein, partial [Clostridium perfringens]